ncbi:MAG: outer membrane lipoprotein carrier protein LolA [Candidatus Latescibacteria bacterium]|jgi:outer membrane lipoprotein carrier protein|nr:outer membrane lipoprotein carrier protein LolA [Candidatus Latescibacterota bacterium]
MMSAWAVMLIGLVAIEGTEAPAKKITAEAITKKMQQRIDKVGGLSAEFSISTYMAALDQNRESSGRLYILRKKSKLRLERADQTIVSDGKSVWTYIPANQQIIVMPAEDSKAGIRPDEFLFFYTNQYTHTLIGDEMIDGVVHYELHLKANTVLADFPELRIWVDSGEWLTRRVLYADDMGSETVVQFTHIRLNPDLPSGTFTLSAPEGVEVVDLR